MKKVSIESPYFVKGNPELTIDNRNYFYACAKECLMVYGENPYGSHGFFTHFLDDNIPEERAVGIEAGLQWNIHAEATIVYIDRGISPGMELGIARAKEEGRTVTFRRLGQNYFSFDETMSKELIHKVMDYLFDWDEPLIEAKNKTCELGNPEFNACKWDTPKLTINTLNEVYELPKKKEHFIDRRLGAKEYTPEEWNDKFAKAFHEANIKFGYYADPDKDKQ